MSEVVSVRYEDNMSWELLPLKHLPQGGRVAMETIKYFLNTPLELACQDLQ